MDMMANMENLETSVQLAIVFSGIYLWVGMLTGVWKYIQISRSTQARAHYYVDIAHRSSLLYAPASLILAVMAYFSVWSAQVNLICIVINLIFFSFSILSYVIHGALQDTNNQFKQPHGLGNYTVPKMLMRTLMILLVVGEVGATTILLLGVVFSL